MTRGDAGSMCESGNDVTGLQYALAAQSCPRVSPSGDPRTGMSPVAAVVPTLDVALMTLTEPGDPIGIQAHRTVPSQRPAVDPCASIRSGPHPRSVPSRPPINGSELAV
jgi:hypothetical protein